jgi:hypothetical protein
MIRGDTRLHVRGDHIKSCGRKLAGLTHPRKAFRPVQLDGIIALERPGNFNIRHGM